MGLGCKVTKMSQEVRHLIKIIWIDGYLFVLLSAEKWGMPPLGGIQIRFIDVEHPPFI